MRSKIKLWPIFVIAMVLSMMASMNLVKDVEADLPRQLNYAATYQMTKITPDTTAGKTDGLDTGSATPPFFFQGLGIFEDVEGYIYVSAITVDSGDAAADIIDTTKDSLIYIMYTACDYNRSIKKVIESDSLISYTGGRARDTQWLSLPPGGDTGGICNNVFFNFDYAIADTDHSVARAGAGVIYTVTVNMVAKL